MIVVFSFIIVLEKTIADLETNGHGIPTCAFKVIFVGDSSVGKTSIISRLCKNE